MATVIDNERFRKLLGSRPAEAVTQLYEVTGKRLLKYATTLTQDEEAAKDIIQDTFLHILSASKKLSNYHTHSIEHYLVRVVRFKAISHYNRVQHVDIDSLLFTSDRPVGGHDSPIENSMIKAEIVLEARQFISTFPPREQECFLLLIDHNLTLDQIAARLKVKRKAVERSVTSARKRLRAWAKRL